MITFSENHESSLLPYEDNQPLACLRDPRAEGLKWAYSLGNLPSEEIVIVGLGAGFHVAALADLDPTVNITVVESRAALIPVFKAQFPELAARVQICLLDKATDLFKMDVFQDVLGGRMFVLSFQECWGQQGELFTEVFANLTGRSLESIRYHFEEFGINMKALYLETNSLLSIHDVMPVVEASAMAENKKQLFRVLDELVK